MVIRKEKVPLADWDKLLDFRHAIWADAVKMSPVLAPSDPANAAAQRYEIDMQAGAARLNAMTAEMQPLREATAILFGDAPPTPDGLAKSLDQCREAVRKIEEKSQRLPPNAVSSLYWGQMLGVAWTAQGWLELESQHLDAAESYLRAAWKLTQDQFAAYELARALELNGHKTDAAHMYELAYVANSTALMANLAQTVQAHDQSAKAYEKLTGKPMTATLLNRGQYDGSLRAEMDKDVEKRQYIPATHLNGEGFFSVAYEDGKPVKAQFLAGEKRLTSLESALEKNRFPVLLPTGSKARLQREIKLICTQYGGCDAYLLVPAKVEMPPVVYTMGGHEIKLLNVRKTP
jgi:tetratricopeptide (TPR) repeat protein